MKKLSSLFFIILTSISFITFTARKTLPERVATARIKSQFGTVDEIPPFSPLTHYVKWKQIGNPTDSLFSEDQGHDALQVLGKQVELSPPSEPLTSSLKRHPSLKADKSYVKRQIIEDIEPLEDLFIAFILEESDITIPFEDDQLISNIKNEALYIFPAIMAHLIATYAYEKTRINLDRYHDNSNRNFPLIKNLTPKISADQISIKNNESNEKSIREAASILTNIPAELIKLGIYFEGYIYHPEPKLRTIIYPGPLSSASLSALVGAYEQIVKKPFCAIPDIAEWPI